MVEYLKKAQPQGNGEDGRAVAQGDPLAPACTGPEKQTARRWQGFYAASGIPTSENTYFFHALG